MRDGSFGGIRHGRMGTNLLMGVKIWNVPCACSYRSTVGERPGLLEFGSMRSLKAVS